MKKLLDKLGMIVVMYGLSLGFVLILGLIFESNIITFSNGDLYAISILTIRLIPYMIAMYLYLGIRELKHDSKQSLELLREDNDRLNERIENYAMLNNINMKKIDRLEKELLVEKKKRTKVVVNDIVELKDTRELDLPFTDLPPQIGDKVRVEYAGEMKEGVITRILDEKVVKYRVKGCGSKKYIEDMMEMIK